jgi:phospholipid/cholesterol/gamma-HCH transport system substrate-binding protein
LNELKVGILTLMAIASMVIVSLKITSNSSGFGEHIAYRTILNDASGIFEKSSIKVAGINAGKIKKIELNGSQALIHFEILRDIKITQNSILKIKSVGFLGDKYLDIYLGDPNAERLKEDSFLLAEGGSGFEEIGKDASDVLKDVKEIARSIRESLVNDKNENVMKEIVENIKGFTETANEVAGSLKNIINGNEEKLNLIVDDIRKTTAQIAFETDRMKEGSLMNDMDSLKPILADAQKTMSDIKSIIEDVKAGKGTVGKLLRDEEVVDKVNETLSGVNRMLNRVNNFHTDIALFSGVNDKHGGMTQFDLDLYPSPERFFRLGVISNDFGPDTYKETTTTRNVEGDGQDEEIVRQREVDESAFKFNLQIGRRLGSFGVRAGIFESKGGLGFDYYIPDWGFRSALEVFDYQEEFGPNVRLLTEFRMWNIFYTKLAAEDLASKSNNQSYTISAGLRFNDEDLAALIGFLAN